jgi:hypothetical protein
MRRADINIGDELFYQRYEGSVAYRAVVLSVDPEPVGSVKGIRVRMFDHDATARPGQSDTRWQPADPARPDVGPWWRETVLSPRWMLGPWEEWRAAQLARRADERAAADAARVRRADAEQAVADANALLAAAGTGTWAGLVGINEYGEPRITVPVALLRELVGGWAYAMEAPEVGSGLGEIPPWRVEKAADRA